MKTALVTVAAILCVRSTTVSSGCNGMEGNKVYIIADNGQRLARCTGCGLGSYSRSVGVHGTPGDRFAMWTLEAVGKDKCALKADNGYYAARCEGCWKYAVYPNSVFVYVRTPDGASAAQWTIEKHGNSSAFKSDTGNFMARCNGCVKGGAISDFAFVHFDKARGAALWKIEKV